MTKATLSMREARAVVLRAQGFGATWSAKRPFEVLAHLGAIQLDSVNVVARSQDLIAFARLGTHAPAAMHREIYAQKRGFEYWGHAASWLPMDEYRYFLPRMHAHRARPRGWWKDARQKHAALYEGILARVRDEGPLSAQAFEDSRAQAGSGVAPRSQGWWDWKPAKLVLEDLFDQGVLMCAERNAGFARIYDLTERVLPAGTDTTDPGAAEAGRHLLRRGFAALGVATPREAADYFRLKPAAWHPAFKALREELVEVRVEGWDKPGYAHAAALEGTRTPRHRPTFLSPFDSLVWERDRTERLFGFHYRLEIYTPEAKRKHGYYVLPLLVNGELVGRADVKLERAEATLAVPAMFLERDGVALEDVAQALRDLRDHLGAERIRLARTVPRGVAAPLRTLV